jgi:hypothetical protein
VIRAPGNGVARVLGVGRAREGGGGAYHVNAAASFGQPRGNHGTRMLVVS